MKKELEYISEKKIIIKSILTATYFTLSGPRIKLLSSEACFSQTAKSLRRLTSAFVGICVAVRVILHRKKRKKAMEAFEELMKMDMELLESENTEEIKELTRNVKKLIRGLSRNCLSFLNLNFNNVINSDWIGTSLYLID